MKTLIYSSQYKKDFKRYKNQPEKLNKLLEVLTMLAKGEQLPEQMRPHLLTGNYRGCMECHIMGDFLLIWIDQTEETIYLLRLGSHSELF